MLNIPTFVSVHLVRHKIGVEHFVLSRRDDRPAGKGEIPTRLTPVDHAMFMNAAALIAMGRKRLCCKAHPKTIAVMMKIKKAIGLVDIGKTQLQQGFMAAMRGIVKPDTF
ncbi:MAG: hypothetical protein ABFS56_26075 [Pseudomonadota bacterium]